MDDKKTKIPQFTANQVRVPLFSPTKTGGYMDQYLVSSERHKVEATITGRLGQTHAAIRDMLLSGGYSQYHQEDGSLTVVFEPYIILRRLGHKKGGGGNLAWLKDRIDEMRQAKLEIRAQKSQWITGILNRHGYTKPDKNGVRKYAVTFSPEYIQFCRQDHPVFLTQAVVDQIALLPPVVAAATRYMLSHSPGAQYRIDLVLECIGYRKSESTPSAWAKKKKQIKESLDQGTGVVALGEILLRLGSPKNRSRHTDAKTN